MAHILHPKRHVPVIFFCTSNCITTCLMPPHAFYVFLRTKDVCSIVWIFGLFKVAVKVQLLTLKMSFALSDAAASAVPAPFEVAGTQMKPVEKLLGGTMWAVVFRIQGRKYDTLLYTPG